MSMTLETSGHALHRSHVPAGQTFGPDCVPLLTVGSAENGEPWQAAVAFTINTRATRP